MAKVNPGGRSVERLQAEVARLTAERDEAREELLESVADERVALAEIDQLRVEVSRLTQERDEAREDVFEIRTLLLGDERDDPNQPTEVLAENTRVLWQKAEAEVARLTADRAAQRALVDHWRARAKEYAFGGHYGGGAKDTLYRCADQLAALLAAEGPV